MRYSRESVSAVWDDLVPLVKQHHQESGCEWPFHVERSVYEGMERLGILHVFTMRTDEGLQGFAAFTLTDGHQHRVRVAFQDGTYVKREYRGSIWSGKFLKWCDEELRKAGAEQVVRFVTNAADYSATLERMGYRVGDRQFLRRL